MDTIKTKNSTSIFTKIKTFFDQDITLVRTYINDKFRKNKK